MLAEALAEGAVKAGAHVRLHRVPELAPGTAIDASPQWRQHVDRTHDIAPEATMEDVVWADCYAFGSPTRLASRRRDAFADLHVPAAQRTQRLTHGGDVEGRSGST
jgi:hypothetical protein